MRQHAHYRVAANPACSGHGYAVGKPWRLVGQSSVASDVEGRHRRAADAIVRRCDPKADRIVLWKINGFFFFSAQYLALMPVNIAFLRLRNASKQWCTPRW